MVLNYLQNVDPPVLPTIEKLSQLHGASARTKIEGWDCTFAMDWQIIPQSGNTQSAAELLSGFFSYWSAFNFNDHVLITRNATEMPFTQFFEKDNMPDGRLRSFKASSMNIQDPFVLNHNIVQNVNEKMRDKIIREFRIAAIKTSVWGNEGFSMMTPSGGGDLIHLLNNEVPDIILQEDQEKQEQVLQKGRMPPREAGEYEFDVELKPTKLSNKLLKQLQKGENYRIEWCKKMCNFIIRILKEVLMLTVEELPEATEEIRQKMKEEMAKKEAADKRNAEIRERRRLRRIEKRKELEEKLRKEEEEMKKKTETNNGEEGGKEGENTEKEGENTEKEGEESAEASGEKRSRPVSIFDLKIEPPKKFRGNRKFELNLDDMIEDSDDGEEIIEYKPDEPELRFKRDCDADVNFQLFMRAWCMTWARRKKAKNYLTNEEGRTEEGIAMEKLISNAIWQNDQAPLPHPVVGFYCYMESIIDGNDTKVRVEMDCKEGFRDFNTFFQFTKMYLYKMIDKFFN